MKSVNPLILAFGISCTLLGWWIGGSGSRAVAVEVRRLAKLEHERAVSEAQALARREEPRWNDSEEMAFFLACAAYDGVPSGLAWPFRQYENGADLYSFGQIVRDQSVRALFRPGLQQPAQALRTIRTALFWLAVTDPGMRRKALDLYITRDPGKPLPDPRLVFNDPGVRKDVVWFIVNRAWMARAGRAGMAEFVLDQWNAWGKKEKP